MGRQLALVRGTGDVGSAIAHLLCRNSFEIVLHDVPRPVHARRGMAFTDTLFAHADRRHQNDGSIGAPGMWRLARRCPAGGELAAEGLRIASDGREQEVLLVASVPLTHEGWVPLAEGEILVARQGLIQR